jgi:hypothetical protein
MPLFYLHLRSESDDLRDLEGMELPHLSAAKDAALFSARDTLSHEMKQGRLDLRYRIDVEDHQGQIVYTLPLSHAFEMIPGQAWGQQPSSEPGASRQ